MKRTHINCVCMNKLSTGPRPRPPNTATGPRPRPPSTATGPRPRPPNTDSRPRPPSTATGPRPHPQPTLSLGPAHPALALGPAHPALSLGPAHSALPLILIVPHTGRLETGMRASVQTKRQEAWPSRCSQQPVLSDFRAVSRDRPRHTTQPYCTPRCTPLLYTGPLYPRPLYAAHAGPINAVDGDSRLNWVDQSYLRDHQLPPKWKAKLPLMYIYDNPKPYI